MAYVIASIGPTLKRTEDMYFVEPTAVTKPIAIPITPSARSRCTNNPTRFRSCAPIAIRMAISRVRCDTEYEVTAYIPVMLRKSAIAPAIPSIKSEKEVRAVDFFSNSSSVVTSANGRLELTDHTDLCMSWSKACVPARLLRATKARVRRANVGSPQNFSIRIGQYAVVGGP